MDWTHFLSGTPAKDYIFQETPYEKQVEHAARLLEETDTILIGAGAGLSTAAGLSYSGKRFTENFGEFIEKYGSRYMGDMYSAGFYPFPTEEAKWGYWSRHAYVNRIVPKGLPLYHKVYELVRDKKHFVLTTNVDHQFEKAGFAREDIFATQGDYGRIQCAKGCHKKTYDAIEIFRQMVQAEKDCLIPSYMVPKCPVCGGPMAMNLRCDQYFVEDEQWNQAAERYGVFLNEIWGEKVVLLELGVGFNTPTIIRFPFEKMMRENAKWNFIRLNLKEALVPESLGQRAVGINRDISESITAISNVLEKLKKKACP